MEFHWTRIRLIKRIYHSICLQTKLSKTVDLFCIRIKDRLLRDETDWELIMWWSIDFLTGQRGLWIIEPKKCCSKPSALWETPIYASLLMCFRLLNSTKKMKKSKNYFKRQKAIIRLVYEMMKLWSMIFNFHGYMCTVPYNCQSKTKNRSAKTNTHGKTKAILLLLWSIWFCREVFGQCCREIFCFCREVFGFAVTVVGPIFILDLWTPWTV